MVGQGASSEIDDDQSLVNFLRGCKHSLERFKEKIDLYYALRHSLPLVYSKWDPLLPINRKLIRQGFFLPLPQTVTPDGPRVILMRLGVIDPNTTEGTIEDVFRVQAMYFALCTRDDDNMVVAGQTSVMDMRNVTMAHMLQMSPSLMKKVGLLAQDANPLRQKGMHYINMSSALEGLLNLFRKFFNEKMTSRVSCDGCRLSILLLICMLFLSYRCTSTIPTLVRCTSRYQSQCCPVSTEVIRGQSRRLWIIGRSVCWTTGTT